LFCRRRGGLTWLAATITLFTGSTATAFTPRFRTGETHFNPPGGCGNDEL
jgi:hypothetical protein